jgi:two-component system, LytTR family, sensor kinase
LGKADLLEKNTVWYHIFFWAGIYLLWVAVFRSYSIAITRTMTIEFCYLLFITADYYVINLFVLPRLLMRKKYGVFVGAVVLVIGGSALLRAMLALEVNRLFFHATSAPGIGDLYLRSFLNISLWVMAVTLARMLMERKQIHQQLEVLEKERIKSELDYLKAQINPHSLFNSLNTIYGHIDKQNQVARNILLQFSGLLRYQLYDCAAEKVSLAKEIAYLQNYVAFQRLRKDEKLIVTFDIGVIEEGLMIAPLLLIVLIENAFKFVSSFSHKENKITIDIHTCGTILYSSIVNTRELQTTTTAGHSNGIGIANLRRRLELLYNSRYELKSDSDYDWYETSLTINLS